MQLKWFSFLHNSGVVTSSAILIGIRCIYLSLFSILCQITIGILALIFAVFVNPIISFNKSTVPVLFPQDASCFSREEELQLVWLGGIAMSGCLFSCTQGLMLICTHAIAAYHTRTLPKCEPWCGYVMVTFTVFIFVGAVGQLGFGILVRTKLGSEALTPPIIVFSNVVTYPNISLFTGILLLIYFVLLCGVLSITITSYVGGAGDVMGCCSPSFQLHVVNSFAVILILWFVSAFVMTNIGYGGSLLAGTSAIVTLLTTVMVLAPVFVFNEMQRIIRKGGETRERNDIWSDGEMYTAVIDVGVQQDSNINHV